MAAALEGNLYYGKTKGPRKSCLLPWQSSALLEQWEKGEGKEKANNTLTCRNFSSRWDILLNQGRICDWWWRARGLFPGTKPKVDFTSFSEVRVNWAYQRKGAERKQKGCAPTRVNCVQVLGVRMGHMEAEEADALSLAVERRELPNRLHGVMVRTLDPAIRVQISWNLSN